MRRRTITVLAMILCAVFSFIWGGAATAEKENAKIITDIPLYAEASYESQRVLDSLKKNEKVVIVDATGEEVDGVTWVKVQYNSVYEGYIPLSYIYFSVDNEDYQIKVVRVTGKTSSEEIVVYRYFDDNSEQAGVLHDGEKVNMLVEQSEEYGDFYKVLYDGDFCFIQKENITTGLTHNQILAIIIASGLSVGIAIAVVIVVTAVKKKRKV